MTETNSEGKILESRNPKVQKCRKYKKLNPIIELFKNPKVHKCKECEIVKSNKRSSEVQEFMFV